MELWCESEDVRIEALAAKIAQDMRQKRLRAVIEIDPEAVEMAKKPRQLRNGKVADSGTGAEKNVVDVEQKVAVSDKEASVVKKNDDVKFKKRKIPSRKATSPSTTTTTTATTTTSITKAKAKAKATTKAKSATSAKAAAALAAASTAATKARISKGVKSQRVAKLAMVKEEEPSSRPAPIQLKGVTVERNRFKAKSSRVEGRQHYLGSFGSAEEASAAVLHFDLTGEKLPTAGPRRAASGFKGVSFFQNRWKAEARRGGRKHYLGYYDTAEEASAAVKRFETTGEKSLPGYKPAASGIKGVSLKGERWVARASKGGRQHYLGRFDTAEEASNAVQGFEEESDEEEDEFSD